MEFDVGFRFPFMVVFFERSEDFWDQVKTFHSVVDLVVVFKVKILGSDLGKVSQSGLLFVGHVVMDWNVHENKFSYYFMLDDNWIVNEPPKI